MHPVNMNANTVGVIGLTKEELINWRMESHGVFQRCLYFDKGLMYECLLEMFYASVVDVISINFCFFAT